jgi:hypothetical protein
MRALPVLVVVVAGCSSESDPLEPTATGVVRLAPGLDPTPYPTLSLRLSYVDRAGAYKGTDVPRPGQWPYAFELGGGIGVASSDDFEVRAWLTTTALADGPAAGEPRAAVPVSFTCDGSCVPINGLELVLAP